MAWENTSNFLRISLLIVVCSFAIFFIWKNEKSKRGSKEQFTIVIEQDYRQSIVKAFNTVLNRDPYEFEVALYRNDMKTPFDTEGIEHKLMNSKEYKSVQKKVVEPEPSKDITQLKDAESVSNLKLKYKDEKHLELYRSIVKVYEHNLFRMPTTNELDYYMRRLQKDKSFNLEKLEKILQMSQEYHILEKNQSNLVNADLEGNITDAQVTMIVREIYKEVYNGNLPKTTELEDFLKIKYIELKFNDELFRKLLIFLKNLESETAIQVKKIDVSTPKTLQVNNANTTLQSNVSQNSVPQTNVLQNNVSQTNVSQTNVLQNNASQSNVSQSNVSQSNVSQNNALQSGVSQNNLTQSQLNTNSSITRFGSSWNPPIDTNNQYCNMTPYNKDKFYDSLYENNKSINIDTCEYSVPRDTYAETKNKRNLDELGYSCSRNSFFTQVDEELMSGKVNAYDKNVVPSMRNTKWGAFLDDANDTKVGSIMPKFVFKEYV